MRIGVSGVANVLLVPLMLSGTAWAQDEPNGGYETVVVGSRHRGLLLEQSRTVDVVTREDIRERPGRTMAELLDDEPGVHAQHTNRGAGAPIIRGQVGPANLIVFDGIRIDNGTFRTGPNQYLNLWDPLALGRIEVLRGPGGVLYGGDAIGGVIHLVPGELEYGHGLTTAWLARFQSVDTGVTVAPEVNWSDSRWSGSVGGSASWFGPLRTGRGDVLPVSDYRQAHGRIRLAGLVQPQTELSLNFFGSIGLDAGRADRLEAGNVRRIENGNYLSYVRVNHLGRGALKEVTGTISINATRELVDRNDCVVGDLYGLSDEDGAPLETSLDPEGCIDGRFSDIRGLRQNDDRVRNLGASLSVHSILPLEGLSLTWGADAYQSFVESSASRFDKPDTIDPNDPEALLESADRGNFSNESDYGHFGAFLRAVQHIALSAAWATRFEAGVRLNHVRAFAPLVPDVGDVEYNDTGVTGSGRLSFLWSERATIYAGVTQGFRPPNLQETTQLGDTGSTFEVPNPNLNPERALEYEVGMRFALGRLAFSVAGFVNNISDLITREDATFEGASDVDGAPVVRRVNAESGRFFGVEGAVELRVHDHLAIRGNLSWVDGEVDTVGGETLTPRRLPPLRWLGAVRFDWPDPSVFAEILLTGAASRTDLHPEDQRDLRICGSRQFPGLLLSEVGDECQGTESWVEVGVRAGLALDDGLTARAALSNLFDAGYRLHGSGVDAAGVSGTVTLEWRQ